MAVGAPFLWVNGYLGTTPWVEDGARLGPDGRPAMRAGAITHNGVSRIASVVFTNTAPPLVYRTAVSSESNYDLLTVRVYAADSGTLVSTVLTDSGNKPTPVERTFYPSSLAVGRYRLVFEYTKDGSQSTNSDTAWVWPQSGFHEDPDVRARAGALLGAPRALAAPLLRGRARASSVLGVPLALAAPKLDARARAGGLLGVPRALASPSLLVRARVGALLGSPAVRGRQMRAIASRPPTLPPRARLLSDPLPLRLAAELPAYRTDAAARVLPWAYGRVTLAAVPLDAAGAEWLVSDHPIVAVERVVVAGVQTDGWQLLQRVDATGAAVAVLRLTQSAKPGDEVAVQLVGRRDPASGAVLEHPADIAADVLRQCGWAVTPDAFQGLRDDYPGLALGLVLDATQTLRSALAAVIEPLGALWSASPGALLARRDGPGAPRATLDARTLDEVSASARADVLGTVARITYARDWAAGRARAAMVLAAPEAVETYGRIEVDIAMPAVRTARDALAIGSARLADLARPRWEIAARSGVGGLFAVSDTVTFNHPRIPAGPAVVRTTARDYATGESAFTAYLPAGAAPRIALIQRGGAVDAAAQQPASVLFRDGFATFTVADDAGNPLAGAAVTLDGLDTANTDRRGQVQFRTTRGAHTLTVYMAGYAPFQMDVIV